MNEKPTDFSRSLSRPKFNPLKKNPLIKVSSLSIIIIMNISSLPYQKTVSVDRTKEGSFKSIQEAIDKSGQNVNILVSAGYYDPFVINRGNLYISPVD